MRDNFYNYCKIIRIRDAYTLHHVTHYTTFHLMPCELLDMALVCTANITDNMFFFPVCQTAVELAFILDSSGSVGSSNFGQVKNFVKNVVDFFNIGSSGTHVAVVTYSTYTRLEFNLKAYYTKSQIKYAVGNIGYRGGWTYTADALDFVRTNIFVTSQVSSTLPLWN